MEGSVMCRLRAAVWGSVGVPTGREFQPSLRPQGVVHAVSDKHNPEGGNPEMELCPPRGVKQMTCHHHLTFETYLVHMRSLREIA